VLRSRLLPLLPLMRGVAALQATRVTWLPPAGPGYVAAERLLAVGGWAQDEAAGVGSHVVRLLLLPAPPPPTARDGPAGARAPPAPAPTPLLSWRHGGAITDLHVRGSAPARLHTRHTARV
jgi:hypothetical protein